MIDSFHPFSGPHQRFQGALVRAVALVREVVLAATLLRAQPPGGAGDCVGCDALQSASPAPGP